MGLSGFAVRNIRQFFGGGYVKEGPKLTFIHVPKCGGSSMEVALKTALGLRAQITGRGSLSLDTVAALRASEILGRENREYIEDLLPYHLAKSRLRYLTGHWALRDSVFEHFKEEWDFILLIRNPVKRFISNYFFNRYKADDHFRINEDLDDFVETYRAKFYGCAFVRYLAPDQFAYGDEPSTAPVEKAISNLDRFQIIGVLEHLDLMAGKFSEVYGAKLHIPHLNRNPVSSSSSKKDVTPEQMKAIEEICRPDMQIYRKVLERILV